MTDAVASPAGSMPAVIPRTDEFGERPAKRPHSVITDPTSGSLDATVSFSAVHDWWQVRNTAEMLACCTNWCTSTLMVQSCSTAIIW